MKIYLDDYRPCPPGWTLAKTAPEAIELLKRGDVEEVSLDYDLGDYRDDLAYTGRAVAAFIARGAHDGTLPRLTWHVHSNNADGCEIMRRMLDKADTFWLEREMHEQENA